MFYTSEGEEVKRFDLVNNVQLTDFNVGEMPGTHAYALRINPADGDVFVADSEVIARLDTAGNVIQTYDAPNLDNWFALNLDPDGTSFWSADLTTGDVFKFDIASGEVLLSFNAEAGTVG